MSKLRDLSGQNYRQTDKQVHQPDHLTSSNLFLTAFCLVAMRTLSPSNLKTSISKPRWIDPNMFASSFRIYLNNSLRNRTSAKPPKIDGYILKSSADVTSYHNLADYQTTSCAPVSRKPTIMKPPQYQAFGATSGVQSNLFYSSTTSESNMSVRDTRYIS